MQRGSNERAGGGPSGDRGLLARVRARTEQEHEISRSTLTPHYAAASIGQPPYVALPDCGAIVVQRKCGWGC
jgi:hypothetical protein